MFKICILFPHIRENGEKPGNFIPLAPGGVMPLKIEKTAKTLEICLPEAIR
jgi:hypothetical protein